MIYYLNLILKNNLTLKNKSLYLYINNSFKSVFQILTQTKNNYIIN
jgi:hypothetical protein